MNASKLLAVAFAASIFGSAAMAQTDMAVTVDPATPIAQPADVQPATDTMSSHPALRPQGMVPYDMVYATAQPDTTPVTREQVKAELVAARADGELSTDADNSGPTLLDHEFTATRTRDEVKNEIALARADHELNTASDNQPVERVFFLPNKTRAEVKAETIAAMHSMDLSQGDRAEYRTDY